MYIFFYRIFSLLAAPLLPLYLRWRVKHGKEDALRIKERYGKASLPRPDGPLIWIHAASMGESQSILPLIKRWTQEYPKLRILLTTVTVTSARHMIPKLPERAFHQYAPLDTPFAIKRFLQHWQPDMVCFVDSELWPNTILAIKEHAVPLVLINGRISERSAARWHAARSLCETLLQSFTFIFAKSEEDCRRFANLGASNPISFGNLKFSSPALPADSKVMGELTAAIQDRTVWLAASTHEGEEAMIGAIHAHLKETFADILTIIVPRHNQRGAEIRALLEGQGLAVAQRQAGDAISVDTDIYVADTMGELGNFYRLASIVFIGGSLVPHGGQNPLEPARLNCAILYGPHMHNFKEFCTELERAGGAMAVADAAGLEEAVKRLLRIQDEQAGMAAAALQVVEQNKHVIEDMCKALQPLLEQITYESA